MSLHRTKATFIGLLEAGRVNEWVVTEKLGDNLKIKMPSKASKNMQIRKGARYIVAISLIMCISTFSSLNFNTESGCIYWSLVLQPTSSFADAMTFHLGTTIASYFYLCNQLLSSSLVWAMLGH
jgi:beta-mannan synthase